jgi:hypothetical protein
VVIARGAGTGDAPRAAVRAALPESSSPVLGVVVTYAGSVESAPVEAGRQLGRVYPLRRGEVLYVGRPPAQPEIVRSDGARVRPAAFHLFPRQFGEISHRHFTVEIDPDEGILVTDYSKNGLYLLRERRHLRREEGESSHRHRLKSGTILIPGIDLTDLTEAEVRTRAEASQFQIICPAKSPAQADAPGAETPS